MQTLRKQLEHHKKKPVDAYIIDMNMPKLTGFEFYKQLYDSFKKEKIPALFLTAIDNLEEKALKDTAKKSKS